MNSDIELRTKEREVPFMLPKEETQDGLTFKMFLIFEAANDLTTKVVSASQHFGKITLTKHLRNYREVNDFVRELEPDIITLSPQHLNAHGIEALIPIVARRNIPTVFQLIRRHHGTEYICLGIEFSYRADEYSDHLVPSIRTLLSNTWQ
jgi:hypothetical protein